MDPRIGSLFDLSPARLAAISSHCAPSSSAPVLAPKPHFTPWSSTHHNTLPPFLHAHSTFHRLNGRQILSSTIAPLFSTWKVTTTFGVSLLYPSISLPAGSIPVSRGDTLTAWPQSLHQSGPFAHRIQEAAWRLVGGRWTVYEFAYDGWEVACNTLKQASETHMEDELPGFLDAFAKILVEFNLQEFLGLRALPGDAFEGRVEVGLGGVAQRFAPDVTGEWDDDVEDCAWFFHEQYVRNDQSCQRHVAISKPSEPRVVHPTIVLPPRAVNCETTLSRRQPEPEPELLTADGWSTPEPEVEDFHATLRKFSNAMIVEDIEVMGDGPVRFHGRSAEMPQRPKSR